MKQFFKNKKYIKYGLTAFTMISVGCFVYLNFLTGYQMDFANPFSNMLTFGLNEYDTISDMSWIEVSVKVVLNLLDFDL